LKKKKTTTKVKSSSQELPQAVSPYYIAYDIETGGLSLDRSMLSAYFAITDRNFNVLDSLELLLKPDKHQPYVIDPRALEVNKIDLISHDKIALTYSDASTKLYNLLQQHVKGKNKLIPLGHNICSLQGDTAFILKYLLASQTWHQFVSSKYEDTLIIAQYLKSKGVLPQDLSLSLSSLASFYKISFKNQHTASADTLCTLEVRKRF